MTFRVLVENSGLGLARSRRHDLVVMGDMHDDAEADALEILRMAGHLDDEAPPNMAQLCRALLGAPPQIAPIRSEACLARVRGESRVYLRRGVDAARSRWLVGHELAEWYYQRTGYVGPDLEDRCDAVGAALVAPRRAYRLALRSVGSAIHVLAEAFVVPQALALLRIGEVTGRPVLLLRKPAPIHRGEPYVWPRRGMRDPNVHPVRLDGSRWGLMAERWAA